MKLFWTLFLIAIFVSCSQSQERHEDQIMHCLYASYEDEGSGFKQAMADYEATLVIEQILEDRSGKSYRAVLEKIVETGDFLSAPVTNSFSKRVLELGEFSMEQIKECERGLADNDNANSKRKELGKVFDSIISRGDMNPSLVANGILSVLDEKDFELDYYKMTFFFMIDGIADKDQGIARQLPSLEEQAEAEKYDLDNALKIQLKEGEDVFIEGEKVTLSQLRKQILGYLRKKHTSDPVISISSDRLTSYGMYIAVQNEVVAAKNAIWDKHALKRYGKPMIDLTEEIQKELKNQHPIHLIEGVNN